MLLSTQNDVGQDAKAARKVVFHRVAENLYRLENTGGYYALVKRSDKQFRRSLKTRGRKLADVDFEKNTGKVTGGERGTKNEEERTIPLTDALRVSGHHSRETLSAKSTTQRNACRRPAGD